MISVLSLLLQLLFFGLFSPLFAGFIKCVKARLQNRAAPSLFQPYRDLIKLFRKTSLSIQNASWIFYGTPYVVFTTVLIAATLVPTMCVNTHTPVNNTIVFVGLLALGRFFLALAGLDIGTAFGGMGSSREMMLSAIAEPVLLLVFFTLSLMAHSSQFEAIIPAILQNQYAIYLHPSFLFIGAGFFMVLLAETGRLPIDNPTTHLELTMTHEAMILEYSGKHLALIEWASQIKLLMFFVLLSNLFFPWGIPLHFDFTALFPGFILIGLKLLIAGILLAFMELNTAKMRLFRAPYFLGIALILCLLGLLSFILLE